MRNLWLIVYLMAWVVYFVCYQRKRKVFDAGSFILITYILYAFCSWQLYNNPEYSFKPVRLFPFVYLFIMLLMAASTVFKYDVTKVKSIQQPNYLYFTVAALFFIVPTLIQSPSIISHFFDGIAQMVVDSQIGNEMYQEATERSYTSGTGGISNIAAIFSSAFYNIGVLFSFYYLTLKKRKKWMSVLLVLSMIVGLVSSVSSGQRTGVTLRLLTIIATFFLFYTLYSQKSKRLIRIVGICIVVLVSASLFLITVSRFGSEREKAVSSVLSYVGQANLNFNNYGLNDGGIRYGDRTVPLFKKVLGFDNVPDNYWQRRDKYPHLKMDDYVFYTFVGDFTIDFGPILAVFLFLLFTPIFIKATRFKGGSIKFHQLILVHFVLCVCVQGGMYLYSFSDTAGNLQLIVMIIAYIVFKFDYNNQVNKRNQDIIIREK